MLGGTLHEIYSNRSLIYYYYNIDSLIIHTRLRKTKSKTYKLYFPIIARSEYCLSPCLSVSHSNLLTLA